MEYRIIFTLKYLYFPVRLFVPYDIALVYAYFKLR